MPPQYQKPQYQKRPPAICHFYKVGKCRAGQSCRFLHEDPAGAGVPGSPPGGGAPPPSPRPGRRRVYDPFRASLVSEAAALQDAEDRPWLWAEEPFYGLDVECIADGTGHRHRIPARVALVRIRGGGPPRGVTGVADLEVLLDRYIRPAGAVASYLTALTGISPEDIADADTLDAVVDAVRSLLPADATVVGQSVGHDLDWLGLRQGTDYKHTLDIENIFRQRLPLTPLQHEMKKVDPAAPPPVPKYRVFSLRQTCLYLTGVDVQEGHHCPVKDASYALYLFCKYRDSSPGALRANRDALHRAPKIVGFSAQCPLIDGVVLSKDGYRIKRTARFIWTWWVQRRGARRKARRGRS